MHQMMEMLARMDANMKSNQEKAEIGHKKLPDWRITDRPTEEN
jgi:hypothetical protein